MTCTCNVCKTARWVTWKTWLGDRFSNGMWPGGQTLEIRTADKPEWTKEELDLISKESLL